MNMKNAKLLFISSLLLLGPITACSEQSKGPNYVSGKDYVVTFDVNYMKLEEGQTFQINATVTDKKTGDPAETTLTWRSSNPKVATVDQTGFVSAFNGGTATITALAGITGSAACTIEVPKSDVPGPGPGPSGFTIYLNETSHSFTFGETFQLLATTSEDAEVTWAVTSGGNIVTVDQTGLVTAGTVIGSATVTASARDKSASCVFEVTDGEDEDMKRIRFFFFIDYNNTDEEDETGTKLLATFKWYPDRPVGLSGLVPQDPTTAPTSDFPYFVGWSDHPLVDTKEDLIDVNTYCSGDTRTYKYIFGIWADVPKGEFIK